MSKIRLVGFDPSLRNWGYAIADYCQETRKLTMVSIGVIQPIISQDKQVRQNSKDIETSMKLMEAATAAAIDARLVFVEVPVGSQNARAMLAVGVCMGILGAFRSLGYPIVEVTPTEVKVTATGSRTATKQQMIKWAMDKHPEANWPMQTIKGEQHVVESKAEHMADAIGAIYAGMQLPIFSILERANHAS